METPLDNFLGHPLSYWVALEKHAQGLNVSSLIEELARAYGKIGFYEQRIKEMNTVLTKTN